MHMKSYESNLCLTDCITFEGCHSVRYFCLRASSMGSVPLTSKKLAAQQRILWDPVNFRLLNSFLSIPWDQSHKAFPKSYTLDIH